MEIVNGTIDDIISSIKLIKESIPKKADITPEEIMERLNEKEYYVMVALENEEIKGLIVSYNDEGDLYLWLGVTNDPGNGVGSKMFDILNEQTNYQRWFVKTEENNKLALNLLYKYGFKEYQKENDILYLEKILK